MRQRSWARNARTLAIGGSAVIGVAVAGLATTMSASAHYILGTTPLPTVGVVGTTPLADQALVYADSTRHVEFFLWAPGTCGVAGHQPRLHRQRAGHNRLADRQHGDFGHLCAAVDGDVPVDR